jgi:hypothetical protein
MRRLVLGECEDLDGFRRRSENLYERVRALFFLYSIHRFHLPLRRLSFSIGPNRGEYANAPKWCIMMT